MSHLKNWKLLVTGYYLDSQLGENHSIPTPVENLDQTSIKCISIGDSFCVALYKDGSVLGWGKTFKGCFGFPREIEEVSIPTKINGLPKIIDVKCGSFFTLFLTEEKTVLIASRENKHNIFEKIKIEEPAVALFGFQDPWIVGESGTVYFYDYEETQKIKKFGPFPGGVPKQIISICFSAILITSSGDALGMSMKKFRPRYFEDTQVVCKNADNFSQIKSLRGVKIKKISGNFEHYFALSEDNNVFVWGGNCNGELGLGDMKDRCSGFVPLITLGNSKVVDIAAGYDHSILVDSSGHVWGFGCGDNGATFLGKEKGPLSKIVEGVVAAHCSNGFSLVELGESPLCEAGTLNLFNKNSLKEESTNNEILIAENKKVKIENSQLRSEILSKEEQIRHLEKMLSQSTEELKLLKKEFLVDKNIRKENEKMKMINQSQNLEISKLKQQIEGLKSKKKTIEKQSSIVNSTLKMKIFSQEEIENFHKIGTIGKGATSKVYKISREEFYSLKILKFYSNTDNEGEYDDENIDSNKFNHIKHFMNEYEIMSQISHPNIIKTFGICYGDEISSPSILLEYCPTNLKKSIKKLTQEEIKQIIEEIISGMLHLHEIGIIHRDLKPENILLDSENHVKICDFGLSTVSSETTHTGGIGTLAYMSPEILNEEEHYTNKVDVYSFGIVLYFILTQGSLPKLSIAKISRGQRIPIPSTIDDFYRTIIEKCLSSYPND
ncbi:hypothetical protein TRFO_33212 [Tritrichomonas foetus]|uniref:Protein kinase domain-containing protein n=1 Tax=Tritrichomonas foetus TaxID=1144522 RepID=A0A1J4JRM5_9EUKA|nr:hypothetical protein TRFO_33212 [Tritrichomonas foetus]|eukprot:OHT00182.1 hypothetical protein TRFO_33212 [Tritrichomonas foetus]